MGSLREHTFAKPRRWRFDFAWPDLMIAFEYEGGTWSGGAHTRGGHYRSDCEKYNTAALMGWLVIRATADMVRDGSAFQYLERAINHRRSTHASPP